MNCAPPYPPPCLYPVSLQTKRPPGNATCITLAFARDKIKSTVGATFAVTSITGGGQNTAITSCTINAFSDALKFPNRPENDESVRVT